jgi:protein-S-isoprenylcysteine O-methyltransferase Ste14
LQFKEKIYPYILATIQLSSLVYLLVSAPAIALDYGGILVESAGLFLGLLAIFQMGIGNFNITPRIKEDGVFVSSGIYSVIRHPMYLAQLVLLLPLVIDYFTYLRLAVWLLLLFVLFLKMNYEEKSLTVHFEGYSSYISKTKRLIPFIY